MKSPFFYFCPLDFFSKVLDFINNLFLLRYHLHFQFPNYFTNYRCFNDIVLKYLRLFFLISRDSSVNKTSYGVLYYNSKMVPLNVIYFSN